jgi:hypothetical protein
MAQNYPVKLQEGLLVKNYVVDIVRAQPCGLQAEIYRMDGKNRGIFLPVESFFGNGRDNLPVFYKAGCGIMIKTRYA